jgi:hypothetical protein
MCTNVLALHSHKMPAHILPVVDIILHVPHDPEYYTALLVPLSVESYGRSCQPAMKPLHALGDEADGPAGVGRAYIDGQIDRCMKNSHHFLLSLCLRPRFQHTLGSRFICARQETDGHASAPGIHLCFFAIF